MIFLKKVMTIVGLGILLAACQTQQKKVPNQFHTHSAKLVTGGQPSQEDLLQLKKAGVKKVINLRPANEVITFDEKAEVKNLGLEYVSLPISGAGDITSENAKKLDELLKSDENIFLHCASGNRVGALLAIRAHEIEGKSVDESLTIGKKSGLGSLESNVKSVLNAKPATIQ